MINWQKESISNLRQYHRQRDSLRNIKERMAALEMQSTSMRGASADSTPVQGGGSRIEDRMLDNLVARQKLQDTYRFTRRIVGLTQRGLGALDHRERMALERFYINEEAGAAERLAGEFGCQVRHTYRIRDEALYKFTIHMYGLLEC